MPLYKSNLNVLNRKKPIEVVLELASFAGGENTKGEDIALKNNEARLIENWDITSLGGMIRAKGFNEVCSGGASYSNAPDLIIEHDESGSSRIYIVVEGDLAYKNGSSITQQTASAFTSGTLSHGVSAGNKCWITNATDNLKYATISGGAVTPSDQPSSARDRIYYHKSRLVAEGGGKTVYGSRALPGNWTAADGWSAANDAWSYTMRDLTYGCVPGFPSSQEIAVFTKFECYALYNFPDTAERKIPNSIGCHSAYTIARGNEGVFFLSQYPKKGIFLWNGVDFIELTENHDFLDDMDWSKRMYGEYRNGKYYFNYNESGSGATYPNRQKIYDIKYGRWWTRPVNTDLSDNFGYMCTLKYSNNELYTASSRQDSVYELETTDNSDETYNTEALYRTKNFSSRDFGLASSGERFPIDETRIKLTKMTIQYFGTTGSLSVYWNADRGVHVGSKTIDLTAEGDKINDTFTVNTSKITTLPPDSTKTISFSNAAIGRRFHFDIINRATGERPEVKKIKIHGIVLEEA